MNPRARHAYLTLVGNKPLLNIVLDSHDTEVLCIEITESHLSNLVQDGVHMALRADKRAKVYRGTMR